MGRTRTGVVIPVGEGRERNLERTLKAIAAGIVKPGQVVLVLDGAAIGPYMEVIAAVHDELRVDVLTLPKHVPGMSQPRNEGVKRLIELGFFPGDYVWFLDTDCAPRRDCLLAFEWAMQKAGARILAGRYDWLAEGAEDGSGGVEMPDPRAASFAANSPLRIFKGDLGAGLACFSGNLMWPIGMFNRAGGFWNEIHHGRCEDGELGLRAVQLGMPISYCGIAVAEHHWHPRNVAWAIEANRRDVPMLNERHPWVESRCRCGHQKALHMNAQHDGACKDCGCEGFVQAIFMVDRDGKSFVARCSLPGCDWEGSTIDVMAHEAGHG